jgi:hypothetical protein
MEQEWYSLEELGYPNYEINKLTARIRNAKTEVVLQNSLKRTQIYVSSTGIVTHDLNVINTYEKIFGHKPEFKLSFKKVSSKNKFKRKVAQYTETWNLYFLGHSERCTK